jgi:hypothetical protein
MGQGGLGFRLVGAERVCDLLFARGATTISSRHQSPSGAPGHPPRFLRKFVSLFDGLCCHMSQRSATLRCTSSPRQNAICRWFRPASGKPAGSERGSFSRNPASFAPRLLRFAEVPAFCLDNPACLESAPLAKVHVVFRLLCDNRVHLESAGIRVEIPIEVDTENRVTTKGLKSQFEERLAARTRRSRALTRSRSPTQCSPAPPITSRAVPDRPRGRTCAPRMHGHSTRALQESLRAVASDASDARLSLLVRFPHHVGVRSERPSDAP